MKFPDVPRSPPRAVQTQQGVERLDSREYLSIRSFCRDDVVDVDGVVSGIRARDAYRDGTSLIRLARFDPSITNV